ncbi:hypothetical protein [Sphingobacterium athyrii]|uniref:hypothetical protein n=1 Tax=Sphingobacterium athyrii TaxID=2152717 RepID=UPI0011B24ECD|nr:hypothetical protein [Sphingobacterium athyrii]
MKQVKVQLKALSEMPNKKQDYETVQKKTCAIPAMSLSSKAIPEIRLLGAGGSAEKQTGDTTARYKSLWRSTLIHTNINRISRQAPLNAVVQSARVHAGSIVAYLV